MQSLTNIEKNRKINKLLVVGHSLSGLESITGILESSGIHSAKPSKREGMNPVEITQALLKSDSSLTDGKEVGQCTVSPIWNTLALDLYLGNMEQSIWHWVDSEAIQLLDFWKSIDSEIAFVLVYDSPANFIGKLGEEDISSDTLKEKLDHWKSYNEALLRFFYHNPERSMLINTRQAMENQFGCLEQISHQIGIEINHDKQSLQAIKNAHIPNLLDPKTILTTFFADGALQEFPEIIALYEEMQSVATLPVSESLAQPLSYKEAWLALTNLGKEHKDELLTVHNEKAEIEHKLIEINAEYEEQLQESELLLSQLHIVQEELQAYYLNNQDKTAEANVLRLHKEELEHKLEVLSEDLRNKEDLLRKEKEETERESEEGEILLSQLHIVQEELEVYYLANQEKNEEVNVLRLRQEELEHQQQILAQELQTKEQLLIEEKETLAQQYQKEKSELEQALLVRQQEQQYLEVSLNAQREAGEEAIKKHLSYRLGQAFVKNSRSPIGWIKLPFALFTAMKEYKKDHVNE